jgi:hypothetical protein
VVAAIFPNAGSGGGRGGDELLQIRRWGAQIRRGVARSGRRRRAARSSGRGGACWVRPWVLFFLLN